MVLEGAEALKESDTTHAVTVSNRAELAKVIPELSEGSPSAVETKLETILDFIHEMTSGSSLTKEPVYTRCKAELRAEEIVAAIETAGDDVVPAEDNGIPTTTLEADELVKESVNLQMGSATSPEEQLAYGSMPRIPNTADKDETQTRILETFQLRPGASDVTSYHDFHTLQIAFQHVWTRIFDGELEKLGRDLYREYVRLKDYGGVSTADLEISTADDLHRLIDEVRKLSQWVEDETPRELRGPGEEAVAARTWTSSISPSRPGSVWQRAGSRGSSNGQSRSSPSSGASPSSRGSSFRPVGTPTRHDRGGEGRGCRSQRQRGDRAADGSPSRRSRSSSSSSSTSRPSATCPGRGSTIVVTTRT